MTHLMKFLRIILVTQLVLWFVPASAQQEALLGSWQLVNHTSCLEGVAEEDGDETELRREMRAQTPPAGQVVTFRPKAKAEQSTRILTSSRASTTRKFLYRYNGELLLILDKKSQTITDSYLVERLTADSLIVSNRRRPCETRIFVKIDPSGSN